MRRVVVTGIGLITPIGNDVETFFESLVNGKCGIDYITKFDTTDFRVKIAAEVKDFEPKDYMKKSEARKQDMYSKYAVASSIQAMNDSGLNIEDIDSERFGVYIGSGTGGMETFSQEFEKMMEKGAAKVSPFLIPMMISNMATGNVARLFHARGCTLPIVTACATSTNAIGEAYRCIKHGYQDIIIAGGTEASIVPLAVAGFTNCMALSENPDPKKACRPFDKNRDGFVMGEGSGILILEEYEMAKRRGAKIYAEICGYGNTNDAYHMTAPDPEASSSSRAIKMALDEAGGENIDPTKIYINAHGTSTPLNDKTETLAIKKVFGDRAKKLHISSTKSMTGHMLGSAGAVESIASILAIKNGFIPPTIGYEESDPECDLDYTPNKALFTDVELALSTSLGFGGHNACVAFRKVE